MSVAERFSELPPVADFIESRAIAHEQASGEAVFPERNMAVYRTGLFLCQTLNRVMHVNVEGVENIPDMASEEFEEHGGLIWAANHRSDLDIPALSALSTLEQPLYAFAKKELFEDPNMAWLVRSLGAYAADRGNLHASTKTVTDRVLGEERGSLMFYPEGTRDTGTEVRKLQPGISSFSLKHNSPILPIGIAGLQEAFPPHTKPQLRRVLEATVEIHIGRPFTADDFPELEGVQNMRRLGGFLPLIRARMQEQLDSAYEARNKRLENPSLPRKLFASALPAFRSETAE